LAGEYGEAAAFRFIYLQEAHPSDGWQVESNRRDGVVFRDPRDLAERRAAALACVERLGLSVPVLLDGMDNAASRAFNAWPERLYVVARGGEVVYQGGKGPYGFDPAALRAFLESYLTGAPR
jgi:hypothetical protein